MTHDPMLNGITRWNQYGTMHDVPDGGYVLFSDLPALIERVREEEQSDWADRYNAAYERGRADAAADVAALPCDSYSITVSRQTVLAAARGGTDD